MTPALDAALDAAFAEHELATAPAALAAVFDRDGVVAWKASGSPRNDGSATGRDTVFRIASMSKSFLAAVTLALHDEGRIDLDRPIDEYLPGTRFVLDEREQRVTVEELLANRSGLPEDNAWGDRQLGASCEEIADLAEAALLLSARPGEVYQYSNIGMSLVGRAIEAVTGRSIEEEVRARFIDPLGLSRTRYDIEGYPEGADIARGFRTFDDGASFAHEPYVGSGALACIGGIFSTVDDIAAWAAFLCSAFTDDPLRPELLSARSRREMQRVRTATPVGEPDAHRDLEARGYGLGLVSEHDRRFGRIAQHSGGLPGFSSHMRWHLATGLGAVAFGNSDAFRAERLAVSALSRTLEALDAPAEEVRPWPAALSAAERIDALLREEGSVAMAGDLIASNLLLDVPDAVRRERLAALLEEAGPIARVQPPFAERVVGAADAAHLRWRIACERGALVCDIRSVGLRDPLVQSLDIALAGPDGDAPATEAPTASARSRALLDGAPRYRAAQQ